MNSTASLEDILRIVYTEHHDPYTVLGIHKTGDERHPSVAVRAFIPDTERLYVLCDDGEFAMDLVHHFGFYEKVFDHEEPFPYRLKRVSSQGREETFEDPYAFLPLLTEYDLYLFGEGNHYRIHEKLGAHHRQVNEVKGVEFSVWAPAARSVSVIGSFNGWDRRRHAMRSLHDSGVWEMFIPDIQPGELYKFEVKTPHGYILDKTDPFARAMEVRPRTASIVTTKARFKWNDEEWMAGRPKKDLLREPMSIYEVHLGSWRKPTGDNGFLSYKELAQQLGDYVTDMGFTHIELLPVMEFPYDASWGYQVTGYYAPTSRFGTPDDFRWFVDHLHQRGIGIILDWVPAHFPKDIHALGRFVGYPLYEYGDPRKGEHMDWGTYIFDFGRAQVRNFLIANALYWLGEFHIDGLRIDAVASMLYLDYSRKEGEWMPNIHGGNENLEAIDFLRQLNWAVHTYQPGAFTVAEESTSFGGVTHPVDANGLGFDFKWNMGWMHDMLKYFQNDTLFRKYHHDSITFSLLYAFNEHFLLPVSHDEVVHGKRSLISKMPGDYWQQFANARLFFGYMFTHPGKKLLFMGQEFGQWLEWNHESQLDWALLQHDSHRRLQALLRDLHRLYRRERALHEVDYSWEGFKWIDLHDADRSLLSFERIARNDRDRLVCVCNLTPVVHEQYRLGVPEEGTYRELLNSDSEYYGGSGVGNMGVVRSEEVPWHDRRHSVLIRVPPLAVLILKRDSLTDTVPSSTNP